MDNILLISTLAILLLYFLSSMSVYKSLYQKVNEEKNLLETNHSQYKDLLNKYEKKFISNAQSIEKIQDSLNDSREELQISKTENVKYKSKIDTLKKRTEDLYAQVNTMV